MLYLKTILVSKLVGWLVGWLFGPHQWHSVVTPDAELKNLTPQAQGP